MKKKDVYMLITKLQFNGLLGKDLAQITNKKTFVNSVQNNQICPLN